MLGGGCHAVWQRCGHGFWGSFWSLSRGVELWTAERGKLHGNTLVWLSKTFRMPLYIITECRYVLS